ncbi:hypothetical protein [Agromyces soli]|uniref:Uncharacterized protein n=1 Tax=Agromyces soli TaxID=659012 RepID=A0ABY4AUA3_9MICO|nr:hypothetical protein [Agromyces soli]UOE26585.1 hypothetical protein MTP13_02050 [Agromyces soli]
MSLVLIRPESRPYLSSAGRAGAPPADADRAAAVLRADVERWSRWWLGLLGFGCASLGAFVAIGMVGTIAALGLRPHPTDLVITVLAALLGLAGIALLVALWWSGRRLLRAAAWWLRLPYAEGARVPRAGGWVRARLVNLEPRVLVRLVSGTLALLLAVSGIALVVRDVNEGTGPMTAAAAAVAAIALAAGAGQLGGVLRLVSALGEADPLWVRIRSRFTRG